MKTFTKHILLLALMVFGVAGAAWASRAPQKWTGPVDIATLVQGDTLAPGFELTGISASDILYFDGGRYSINGTPQADPNGPSIGDANSLSYPDGNIVLIFGQTTFTMAPMVDMTTAGNAWVVTDAFHPIVGSEIHLSGITIDLAPDPTVPALDELTGNWNFLMPGANKVVKVTYKAEPALAWTYGGRAIPNDTTITAYRGFELPVIGSIGAIMDHDFLTALLGGTVSLRYGSTNPAVISFADPNNMWSVSVNGAGECNVYMVFDGNDDYQYDSVAFHAVIAEPYTLTLAKEGNGTVSPLLGGATWTTETWANLPSDQNLSPLTFGDITISTTGSLKKYSDYNPGKLSFFVIKQDDTKTLTFSSEGDNFTRIEMTMVSEYSQYNPDIIPADGWTFHGHTAVWEGDAPSVTVTSCSTYVDQITFTRGIDSIVVLDETAGTYAVIPGATVQVVATAQDGNHVQGWNEIDKVVTNLLSDTATIVVNQSQTLTATFAQNPLLTLAVNDANMGTVTLDGVTYDTVYNITFENWDNPEDGRYFTIPASRLPYDTTFNYSDYVQAADASEPSGKLSISNRGDYTVTIRISGAFEGYGTYMCITDDYNEWGISCTASTVPVTPDGITKISDNTYRVLPGTEVQVVATAVDGAHVSAWSPINKAVTNLLSDTATFTVGETMTLTATFVENPLLTLNANEGGSVTLDGAGVSETTVTWTQDDLTGSGSGLTTYTKDGVTIQCDTRLSGGKSFNGPVTISTTLGNFTSIAITGSSSAPTTADGFTNNGNVSTWTGNVASLTFPNAIAYATQFVFTIESAGLPEGVTAGTTANTYLVLPGTEVKVIATPDSAHYFKNWTGEADAISNIGDTNTLTMGTDDMTLTANFQAKPTLTLTQTEGGTLEAIVPQGGAIDGNDLLGTFTGNSTTIDGIATLNPNGAEYDANTGWGIYTQNTDMTVTIAEGVNVTKVKFIGNKGGYYEDTEAPYQVTLYQYYEGFTNSAPQEDVASIEVYGYQNVAANVIASSTPNTYIIDYGTDVTVKATPDATHYLVNFDGTDVRNDNDTATKVYTNVTAPFTSTANFAAKPTLALTSNEGGEMSLPGYTPSSFTVSTFEFPGDWSELSMSYFIMAEDLPTDFSPVTEAEMRNWNPGIEGNYIVFFRPHTDDRAVIAKYVNGVATSYSLTARKKTAASTYEGYQIYYVNSSTPAVFPEGVVAANNTLDTFVVNYGADVTVKATPSDTAYLVRFDNDADTNSNVAVEKTYQNITEDTTSRAYFNDKPVLTLAANDTTWGKVTIEGAGSAGGAGGEVTIGDSTSTTVNIYIPGYTLYDYAYSQQIYTADEIGLSGDITSLTMWLKNTSSYARELEVYMKEIDRSEFASIADWESLTSDNLVASGIMDNNIDNPVNYTFNLTTPFHYSGTGNLLLCIRDVTGSWSSGLGGVEMNATGNQAIYAYRDGTVYDISNPGVTGYLLQKKNVVKFHIAGSGMPADVVKIDSVTYRVDYGTTVTVNADATELHHVKNWVDADSVAYPADSITYSDYFVTTPEPLFPAYSTLRLKVTADTVTEAIFGINSYDVFARVDTTEDVRGTVRAEYIDIDGVSQSVAADDTVTYTAQGGSLSLVIATPTEPGYHFERWTDTLGAELGTNDTLEVTEAAAVIAVFDTNVYQISGTVAEGSEEWGEVTGSGDYRHFTQATLEALPIEHYHFVKWEDGNTENPRVIDVVGPESHQAEFAIDRFIVSWSSNDEAMGHVVGPYDNHTTGAPIPRLRGSWGTTFQLVAQPAEHYMLDYWSSGQTTNTIQHTITGNAELVAYFKHVPYIVTVLSEDETMGTVAGTDTLEWQESTEISATANYGYHFTMWNDGVTDNPRTVVNNIESDQTFTASFAKNEYTVTVVSADETMGSVAGTDTVEYLDEIEISATANEHYHFVQWNDGETANPRTVSVTKNETYTATFAPNVYTLTLGSNNAIMGAVALTAPAVTPNADGSYSIAYGTAVTVQGSASSRCFELGSWSDGAVVTADGSHSFSMAGNLVLTATFVNHLFRSDTVADVCDRFVWHGIAYTETPDVAPLHRLTTVDGCDSALVLNLTVRHSSTGVDEQVHCTPYTWIDGVTYSESNHTAQYILPGANAEQCDSIVTLDLTIGTQAESTEVVNACDSYEWHGVVYTETPAEAPTHTYHTLEGCDSTVTLQLTIGHPTEGIETIVACAPIEWHGTVYSESTDEPTWHTTNAAGCDSTVTLHLTIAPAIETEETVEACDEYEWHGVVYTETPAEAPTYTTVSVQGCDSTVTLHLTVNHSTAAVETVVACNSYEWHGVSYASSTTVPTYTTTGSNGCDSTVTLHLTINRSTSAVETVEACDSYEWHGTTYTASTSLPTYTTEGSNGCDSTTTLNLTIKQSSRATETVVTCDEYEWHGVLFTETPVEAPTYTTEGSNGCDSTVTLNLTVNHSADVVETIGACAAIEWHGTVYSESTTEPTWHSTTVAGCDSTVTLHLTISDRIETEETVVACDSYEWHGVVYTASTDNATWSATSIQGCDSTVTLHLTINRSTTGSETIEACESYEWHGVTYRQSGSYTFDTLNVAGCDSTVTLTLTLHQPTSGSEFVTTCGSYVWHEVTYTQSGAYVWHGTDVHGCDSTVTLLLTILQPVYSTENRTACNSYTWHGTEYSESGDYTWSTTAVSGCDSIVTLHLTINLPVTSDVEESACERYTWNGIVYSTSGDYVQTFTGVNGCDSTVTLHLTVNMPATETLGVTACDSYEWHEVTYTESGVYSWHGTTVAGCDSTATLNLTIGHSADTTISLQGEGSIVWNGETFTQSGTYERVIRTVLGCDSTVTLNLVILPEGFVMPYLYNIMDVVLTINHFQQGETNLQYHWYRWYRNGKMVAEGRAMDTYSEGGSKLNGVYYLEVAIDESLEYWVRSNEVTIGTVGIDEAEDIDFTVAPNPVMHGSTVSVAVEGADVQGAVISVYDVQGREVLRQQNSAFIEAPAASGMYMVRLTLNDGRTAVKRLIVK